MPSSLVATNLGLTASLCASDVRAHVDWLATALGGPEQVTAITPDARSLGERIGATPPRAVFIDFSGEQAGQGARLAAHLRREWPDLLLIGIGHASETQATLTALRAGVDDFVDLGGPPGEVLQMLLTLGNRRQEVRPVPRGRTLALLGARGGLGVSTLACNLAALLQSGRGAGMPRQGVALLDMGLPARDGLLYLDMQSGFSFVDGVHNLRRLDQTLLQTALAQHASGTAVLPLPADLTQLRAVSHADSVALIQRMTEFFDLQIADLGGLSNLDFVAQVAQAADEVWVVCDQSIGAIVSTAQLLSELRDRQVPVASFSLVLNRLEKGVGLGSEDIARQLGLRASAHPLPARGAALLGAAAQGRLLAETDRSDPYVQALAALARTLGQGQSHDAGAAPSGPPTSAPWSQRMNGWLAPWKGRK